MKTKVVRYDPGRKCQIPNPNPQNAQSSTLHFNGLVIFIIPDLDELFELRA